MQADSLPAESQGKPKNTGVGSLSLLQGISQAQEWNQGLLHCRQIVYQLSYQGSPKDNKNKDSLFPNFTGPATCIRPNEAECPRGTGLLRTLDSTYLLLQVSAEPLQASKYKCPFNSVLRGQDRPATQAPVPRHTGGTPPLPNLVHLPTAGKTLLFQEAAFTGCSSSHPVGKDRILPSYRFVRKRKKIFF